MARRLCARTGGTGKTGGDTIKIRFATNKDYTRLFDLWHQIDRYHADALPELFQAVSGAPRDELYFQTVMESGSILLAEADGEVLGIAQVVIRQSEEIDIKVPRKYAHVDTLVVAEGKRGQGIGRALMLACDDWARQQGLSEIDLSVYEFNQPARRLYESLGYQTYKRHMSKNLD
ncbi:MAG: GNAT family N-acetyltransferase [Anaerolineae bacterium]|nr:GNAT family N-acetyltransferase [Anaerolineae bacterium]